MDKASGVYYFTIDNSTRPSGGTAFGGIVPMYTLKGVLGKLVSVNASNYRDLLGYDLSYNQAYLGLDQMLQSVASLEILRLNQNALVGNFAWKFASVLTGASQPDVSAPSDLLGLEDVVMWVAHKTPGSWGSFGVRFVNNQDGTYTLEYGEPVSSGYSVVESKIFSFDKAAGNYWKKVSFSDLVFWFKTVSGAESFPTGFSFNTWVVLGEGDNGSAVGSLTVDQLNTRIASALDGSEATVMVGNGFSAVPDVCSALVRAGESKRISVFIDVPDLTSSPADMEFTENDDTLKTELCNEWADLIVTSEYCQLVAVPDIVETSVGDVYIWPSVSLFKIYARMYSNFSHTRYPPAGYSYGNLSVSNLMESDFHAGSNPDLLKTHRVNYQMRGSRGPVMWEYRTKYGLDSDLSYASTVFILRDLRALLVDFMANFNFRFATPMDLLNIKSGLDVILGSFKNDYFLVNYTLTVPSYEEAQAAGRELDIGIAVSVVNSMDVINLRVVLENAATLVAA
jgi:hypothetical protein